MKMKFAALVILFVTFLVQSNNGDPIPATAPSRELTISELNHFANTEEGKASLEEEFKTIRKGKRRSWIVAELPENLVKNRYDFVLPYDDSRVVLETLPNDPRSDYINAGYLEGQNNDKEYIATQNPLNHTMDDFWRMIWQLNITKIIMLTNLVENEVVKGDQYWPNDTKKYGNINVTLISAHNFQDINHFVRTFSLEKDGENTVRSVRHFHYTGWLDHEVPSDRLSIVALIQQARNFQPDNKAPIVVHCSAGLGRTGTIILTDFMMQKAKAENIVNFPATLDHMRDHRFDAVENEIQYIFAHQVVYDFMAGNDTDYYLKNVSEEYEKYSEVNNKL